MSVRVRLGSPTTRTVDAEVLRALPGALGVEIEWDGVRRWVPRDWVDASDEALAECVNASPNAGQTSRARPR